MNGNIEYKPLSYNFTTDADLYVNIEENEDSGHQVCKFVIEKRDNSSFLHNKSMLPPR